jgi:hypothetical protein
LGRPVFRPLAAANLPHPEAGAEYNSVTGEFRGFPPATTQETLVGELARFSIYVDDMDAIGQLAEVFETTTCIYVNNNGTMQRMSDPSLLYEARNFRLYALAYVEMYKRLAGAAKALQSGGAQGSDTGSDEYRQANDMLAAGGFSFNDAYRDQELRTEMNPGARNG